MITDDSLHRCRKESVIMDEGGQIIVRHMCATGEPSKPRPSAGCLKFLPSMSSNSSKSTVTFGSTE